MPHPGLRCKGRKQVGETDVIEGSDAETISFLETSSSKASNEFADDRASLVIGQSPSGVVNVMIHRLIEVVCWTPEGERH